MLIDKLFNIFYHFYLRDMNCYMLYICLIVLGILLDLTLLLKTLK